MCMHCFGHFSTLPPTPPFPLVTILIYVIIEDNINIQLSEFSKSEHTHVTSTQIKKENISDTPKVNIHFW
jgi:hypothetical protein